MTETSLTPGVIPGRLDPETYAENFADLHPRMDDHTAVVAADRCYFCHDAPCITACPTAIDIPLFIRQIATGTPEAAAETILEQNILGGMCARVCPTETLCEEACVRELAEGKPVLIGQLQRYATDTLMDRDVHPFTRAASTGRHIAVVGAGPAGLACAHRLAMKGHEVTLHDGRDRPGGLNEYGIAAYKTVDDFAEREVDWLLQIGGITLQTGSGWAGTSTSPRCARTTMPSSSASGWAGSMPSDWTARTVTVCTTRWISSPSCARPETSRNCPSGATWWSSAAA